MKLAAIVVVAGTCAIGACGPTLADVSNAHFKSGVTHPYLPLTPGTAWHYQASAGTVDVEVQDGVVDINGVAATALHTTERDKNGDVVEESHDYFAQDDDGNVWNLGEDTCDFAKDACKDKSGAWRWGTDDALPGIAMPSQPKKDGVAWRVEYQAGHAEDVCSVEKLGVKIASDAGDFDDCVVLHVTSTLEKDADAHRTYCKNVGFVAQKSVDDGDIALVSRTLFAM